MAQLQFLREWKLSDRRLYEVFERRLLIWGNPKEINSRQINLVSVGAKGHAFFLRHPVYTILIVQYININFYRINIKSNCRSQWPRGLRRGCGPLACRICWFEPRRGHGSLSLVSVVCRQVEVSATCLSLVQRGPTDYVVSECDQVKQ